MATPPIYKPSNTSLIQQHARLFLGATDFTAFGTSVLTRGAKGIYYWAQAASETVEYVASLKTLLRNFTPAPVNYSYANPSGPLSLNSVTAQFLISTANLTSGSVGVSKSTFPATGTGTAPTVTDILAPAALPVAFATNLQATVLTPANPAILPLSTDELDAEVIIVTPASSTFRLYGLLFDFMYNLG
jgi:hypothetical protein